jgi:hypothetical protein
VREPVVIEDLLRALGIHAQRKGTKWHARCPAPKHDDAHPSWMIRDDPSAKWHGSHSCRSCGLAGGPWELVAAVRGCSLLDAAAFVRAIAAGRTPGADGVPDVKVRLRRHRRYELPPGVEIPRTVAGWYRPAFEYLLRRGITEEQIFRWAMGYAITGPLAWRVVIPIVTRGKLVAYAARAIFDDGSKRYDMPTRDFGARPDAAIWGEPHFDKRRGAITTAEGVFSALALERAGAPNPCALLGSQLTPLKMIVLSEWPVVLTATDPDPAGDRVADELRKVLARRATVERVELECSPDDYELPDRPGLAGLRHAVNVATGGFAHVHVT